MMLTIGGASCIFLVSCHEFLLILFSGMIQEPTLRVVNHSRVFALGDTSSQESDIPTFPATAQVAFQQADFVAWNLWASINGRQLLSFRSRVCDFSFQVNDSCQ